VVVENLGLKRDASAQLHSLVSALTEGRLVLLIILVSATIRVGLASVTGLGVDESYWASLARFPSLGYIDDAPMQAWLVTAFSWLLGSEAPLILRLPFIGLFAGSTWLMYRLTAQFFGKRAGLWAAVALNVAPIFTLADATWILPDGPLIFFQLATANILARILFGNGDQELSTLWWTAAGFCGGCALLSKYHAVFLFLGTLVFLLTVRHQRRWLSMSGPWLGAGIALIVFSPVILWNVQHDFSGVAFHFNRVGAYATKPLYGSARIIMGSALYLSWLIVPLFYLLARALALGPSSPKSWFLALLGIGPVVLFSSAGLWSSRHFPHWSMPGWLFAFPLLGEAWALVEQRRPKYARYSMATWSVFVLIILAGLVAHIKLNGPTFNAFKSDPTLDLIDWIDLRAALSERHLIDEQTPAVVAVHWTEAAKATYAIGPAAPVLCICEVPQHFDYLYNQADFAGRDMIVVGTDEMLRNKHTWISKYFERLEPLEPVQLYRGEAAVKTLRLFRGVSFHVQ
jgi:4-amino-4-deoxy-L-arabinose transferase-like glycosyltransferase